MTPPQGPFRYRPRLRDGDRTLWRSFAIANARILRALDDHLRADHGLDLPGFEVLYELTVADGNQLRMAELAERLVYTRSGITRLVNRLAQRGYLERLSVHDDARGVYAQLTAEGFTAFSNAVDDHLKIVQLAFFGALGNDASAFERVLARINDSLR